MCIDASMHDGENADAWMRVAVHLRWSDPCPAKTSEGASPCASLRARIKLCASIVLVNARAHRQG
jgi:hypothetical protein